MQEIDRTTTRTSIYAWMIYSHIRLTDYDFRMRSLHNLFVHTNVQRDCWLNTFKTSKLCLFEFIFLSLNSSSIIKSTLIFFLIRRDNNSFRHNEKKERQCISYRETQEKKELRILLFERENDSNWRENVKVCIEEETKVCYVHTTKTNKFERKKVSNRIDEIRKKASKIFWKEREIRWESRVDHDNYVNYYNVWISKTYQELRKFEKRFRQVSKTIWYNKSNCYE